MESLLTGLENMVNQLISCDPAIAATKIIDTDGMELAAMRKTRMAASKENIGPLVNAIMKFIDRFLKYLKPPSSSQPYVFTWEFEGMLIFAAYSEFGTIVLYAEPDVNQGYVKIILKRAIAEYNQLMRFVFE